MLILIFGQHYINQFYDIERIRIMTSIKRQDNEKSNTLTKITDYCHK